METISKGSMLTKIFAHMDKLNLSNKMVQLFIDNGLQQMDLTELRKRNKAAFDKWYKYHHRHNRLMAFSTFTVLER